MANGASLYFTDEISVLTFEDHYKRCDGSEREYLDSRHQVPLAWFLFFVPDSVRLEQIKMNEAVWNDVYLCRAWTDARHDFLRRAPLFLSWFVGEYQQSDVDEFVTQLDALSPDGPFLVLDPNEFEFQNSGPGLKSDLADLDDDAFGTAWRFELLNGWSGISPPDDTRRRHETIFGNWYGLPDEGYFPRP